MNFSANIGESIQKSNKKIEKIYFLVKKNCFEPFFASKNGIY
jgi:hypothetical protein